jgi:hypothetical protein
MNIDLKKSRHDADKVFATHTGVFYPALLDRSQLHLFSSYLSILRRKRKLHFAEFRNRMGAE